MKGAVVSAHANHNPPTHLLPVMTEARGEEGEERGNTGAGGQEVQTIMWKIRYKDVLYSTEHIANIL